MKALILRSGTYTYNKRINANAASTISQQTAKNVSPLAPEGPG
ncbi:MAG: hypothetical protein R2778_03605 [Saprospiraceae bacterium]